MKILAKCDPRAKVSIHRETFRHTLPEVQIFDVESVEDELIPMLNDDGGLQHGPNGNERYKRCVVMRGDDWDKKSKTTSKDRKELADFEARRGTCLKPPVGWQCNRGAGHDGPCAAVPTT
jgi:hypothetical protein